MPTDDARRELLQQTKPEWITYGFKAFKFLSAMQVRKLIKLKIYVITGYFMTKKGDVRHFGSFKNSDRAKREACQMLAILQDDVKGGPFKIVRE